jgi:hypothetical protein
MALKMETTCFTERSVDFQRTTRRYISEDKTTVVIVSNITFTFLFQGEQQNYDFFFFSPAQFSFLILGSNCLLITPCSKRGCVTERHSRCEQGRALIARLWRSVGGPPVLLNGCGSVVKVVSVGSVSTRKQI